MATRVNDKSISLVQDPTFLFASLCLVIMVLKKLLAGDIEKVTSGFIFNPYVVGTFVLGAAVWTWAGRGKQVTLSLLDQWTANWFVLAG